MINCKSCGIPTKHKSFCSKLCYSTFQCGRPKVYKNGFCPLRGRTISLEVRAHMTASKKGHICSEETRAKIGLANLGHIMTEEARHNMSNARRGTASVFKNPQLRAERISKSKLQNRDEISRIAKNLWKDPEYAKKVLGGGSQRPNKPEKVLLEMLKSIDGEWKYVGNGSLMVSGKYPDFWNGDHKLAELFGDYWHRNDNEQYRIDLFKQEGYDTLIVWEHELKDVDQLRRRISDFNYYDYAKESR